MLYGFIGAGNMGSALAHALCKRIDPTRILIANRTHAKAQTLAAELGCTAADNLAVGREADMLFLGVKPQMMAGLLEELAPILAARQAPPLLITMAAGLTVADIRRMAGSDYPVLRIMPNTPVSVGEGVILYTKSENVSQTHMDAFLTDMQDAGRLVALDESRMDAGSAVSGCGPAFADLFVEALADGGVACGLPRAQAMELAAQMLLGSAKLILDSGKHPGQLKDAVCSPGGTTIQGVRALEAGAFRATVMNAVIAAYKKTLELKP